MGTKRRKAEKGRGGRAPDGGLFVASDALDCWPALQAALVAAADIGKLGGDEEAGIEEKGE